MCDVVETWNRTACGVMCRLPTELLAQSFSWLDPLERAAKVTAVSRYFRSVALAYPALWTQIELSDRTPGLYDALALLLERSRGATLNVNIYADEVVTALLIPHVPRMRTLITQETLTTPWIFEQPAPILEVLEVRRVGIPSDGLHTVLPSATWAPVLRRLELPSTFVLPRSGGKFDRVTYFSGYMTARGVPDTDARALFEVFPSLEILKLSFSGIVSVDNLPNTRFPAQLMELVLDDDAGYDNITSVLGLWRGHPFRVVNIRSAYGRLAIPVLDHMRSFGTGLWHFDLTRYDWVLKSEHDIVYELVDYGSHGGFDDLCDSLHTLGSMSAYAPALEEQLIERLNMPSLHSITLRGAFSGTSSWDVYKGKLCVPELQTLRLDPERYDKEDWQAVELRNCSRYTEQLVRRLALTDGTELPKIPRLVFSEVARPYVGEEYWAWIYQRASSVYIEDELLWQEIDS
ncbi:hypothetical protein EXIGLDRAFT_839782 [Exidia glandulosa HHB12029]|uniref:F-box domain-containing protein n=1 Tax=Exidia glandulosa HHB12029 TaxID=1314781 RepID=A0A165ETZ4_EXIGL|nr:hypothetical protein EXIGLDRAFT_839782 [Exidia glandulosa HHB12029]